MADSEIDNDSIFNISDDDNSDFEPEKPVVVSLCLELARIKDD